MGISPLSSEHGLEGFSSGVASLDEWLKTTARKSQEAGNARTFVLTEGDSASVLSYYCLAAGSVSRKDARGPLARNSPDPIPVVILGRLAVALAYQGKGIGTRIYVDAIFRIARAAEEIGAKAVVVNPVNDAAHAFWLKMGFSELAGDSATLFMRMSDVRKTIDRAG